MIKSIAPYTTPTHIYDLPFASGDLAAVRICYAQGDVIKVIKTLDDCVLSGNSICVTLTQEETGLFDHKYQVQIQLHMLTHAGVAMQSDKVRVDCDRVLDGEVIGNAD